MMYIDQAPLGGNLVNIIKKSSSLNNVAATPLAENSAPPSTKEFNYGGGEDDSEQHTAATKQKTRINGEQRRSVRLSNGNHFETSLENQFKTIFEYLNQKSKAANSQLQQNENEEEEAGEEQEDKSQYELYDIESDQEDTLVNTTKTDALTNGFSSFGVDLQANKKPHSSINTVNTTTTTSNKRTRATYEAEDDDDGDCEEFIIKIKPVSKSKSNSLTTPTQRSPTSEKFVLNKYISRPASRNTYEFDDSEETEYHLIPCSAGAEHLVPTAVNPMGIDIFGGLWNNLFNRKTKAAVTTEQDSVASNPTRKRSIGFLQSKQPAPQFKYRRVDNSFPKIITHALDDDVGNFSNTRPVPRQIPGLLIAPPPPLTFGLEMSQRADNGSLAQRRSLFQYPQKKVVRNTTYADVEFSDDDDDDGSVSQMRRLEHTLETLSSKRAGLQQQQQQYQQPKVRNIPIQVEQACAPQQMFMPSLASSTNYMNTLRQPTYADILKQTGPYVGNNCHVLNSMLAAGGGSSNNSSADGASSSRFGNALGKSSSRINSKSLGNSILRQERAKQEHEQYKQLLETLTSSSRNNRQNLSNTRPQSSNLATIINSKNKKFFPKPRAPLSSTINIADDEDDEHSSDDIVVTGTTHLNNISRPIKSHVTQKQSLTSAPFSDVILDLDDDDDDDDDIEISEIIDLDDGEDDNKEKRKTADTNEVIDLDAKENKLDFYNLPYVEPVNTFREFFQTPILQEDWVQNFNSKWARKGKVRKEEVGQTIQVNENLTSERCAFESDLRARFQDVYIVDPGLLGVDDFEKPEEEEIPEFPELNQARIKAAICGPADQVLVEKFNLRITRRDLHTLLGLNWLNDEVINFYMSMITERSEKKHESHGYPKVYAMNTFFLQRVLQSGHGGVKRWTRKVDIFEKDIIPVPVHVGGVHWCMAIIHLKNKWIRYYDSMGAPNPNVLKALEQYLKDESLDKRKQPFDTSGFSIECVADVPRQQNGSDCGVFSCMFAEYTARNKPITFEQKHMEYFRHKMIQEIVEGELLL